MSRFGRTRRIPPGPGQESAWDYPRPPALQESDRHIRVRSGDLLIADTSRAVRVLETSHPPNWYLPPDAVAAGSVRPADSRPTVCEWKGRAIYWDVSAPDGPWLTAAAWGYPDPRPGFEALAGYLAFYPGLLDCTVDGEPVRPQAGGFYGGWITDDVVGPFKGEPGTLGW